MRRSIRIGARVLIIQDGAERIVRYVRDGVIDQVFLEEPIMPDEVWTYLKPKV